jgi:hypothetical protein
MQHQGVLENPGYTMGRSNPNGHIFERNFRLTVIANLATVVTELTRTFTVEVRAQDWEIAGDDMPSLWDIKKPYEMESAHLHQFFLQHGVQNPDDLLTAAAIINLFESVGDGTGWHVDFDDNARLREIRENLLTHMRPYLEALLEAVGEFLTYDVDGYAASEATGEWANLWKQTSISYRFQTVPHESDDFWESWFQDTCPNLPVKLYALSAQTGYGTQDTFSHDFFVIAKTVEEAINRVQPEIDVANAHAAKVGMCPYMVQDVRIVGHHPKAEQIVMFSRSIESVAA